MPSCGFREAERADADVGRVTLRHMPGTHAHSGRAARTARTALLAALLAALAVLAPAAAHAQQRDSSRAPAGTARRDSVVLRDDLRAPLSPRRAFAYSLVAPGYAQSVLGRPTAAAVFVLAEAIAITMIRESSRSAREAARLADDSIVVSTIDPVTGQPKIVYGAPRYPEGLVRARRAQVEDWVAALLLNHLFSGADAFVAAHLWDVPAQLSMRTGGGRTALVARVRW